jgi:hypothetical protein
LHAFPAKRGPNFCWYFYEAACLNGNKTALRSTELALTITEIAEAQSEDVDLKALAKTDKYEKQLVEDTLLYCKDGKLVLPKPLQIFSVERYHHNLQHPRST